mmetsp:Transcript_44382/g.71350  ORF Transcript_44382/g.71350 Transcript_44382/m.71350 type:complete len:399 (+) Transcript_44382:131-1327(+)
MGGACSSTDDNLDGPRPLTVPPHRLEALYTFKLLLLGPGESGKSTVLKQLKGIYNVRPTPGELEECKKALHQNTLECMKVLCDAANTFEYSIEDADDKRTAEWLQEEDVQYNDALIDADQAKAIQKLFKSEAIQNAFARRDEFWLLDACEYYVDNVTKFAAKDYTPDEKDMVMCRIRTTGKNLETKLKVNYAKKGDNEPEQITYEVVDVGGQRNERKKWIKMFSDVKAIIFLVNLAGYNQVLYEDKDRNRMAEALEVFGQITGWRDESKMGMQKKNVIHGVDIFKNVPIYLLLNKKDIFENMIHKVGLDKTFPDYKGANKCDQAVEFIKDKFKEKCPAGKEVKIWAITGVARPEVKNAFREIEKDLLEKYQPRIKEEVKKCLADQRRAEKANQGCSIC